MTASSFHQSSRSAVTEKLTYISGPMSGYADHNFPAFMRAELIIGEDVMPVNHVSADYAFVAEFQRFVNPASMGTQEGFTHADYLRRDIKAMIDCDAIVLIPGWESSVGSNAELDVALVTGMGVYELFGSEEDGYCLNYFDTDPRGPRTLSEWMVEAYATSKASGFHPDDDPTHIDTRLLLITGEVNEAQGELRDGHGINEIYFEDKKPEGFGVELADVFIRLADLCATYMIPLQYHVAKKNAYNKTRPFKHGKKF